MSKTILVTNDDGIHASGILELKKSLEPLGRVVVVAPDRARSACGHGITLHKPLRVHKVRLSDGDHGYATSGLPTDCVHIGTMELCSGRPDLVVSGINLGANLGWELTYSGTVAGAMEGAAFGIPSFAISVTTYEDGDVFGLAARFARFAAERILSEGLPDGIFLNINAPPGQADDNAGVTLTHLGIRRYPGRVEVREDPMGRKYYWLGGDIPLDGLEEGTDLLAVSEGRISVTPVHLDMTAHPFMERLRTWNLDSSFSHTPAPTA